MSDLQEIHPGRGGLHLYWSGIEVGQTFDWLGHVWKVTDIFPETKYIKVEQMDHSEGG